MRTITIGSSGVRIALPNGRVYSSGDVVILTDEQWSEINPNLIGTIILDGGELPPPAQVASTISDSTAVGRAVLTAVDAAAARTAVGAGTSSLVLGTMAGTALDAADAGATYGLVDGRRVVAAPTGVAATDTANVAATIAAAKAAGGLQIVQLQPGTYSVNPDALTLDFDNVTLQGWGPGVTQLSKTGNGDLITITCATGDASVVQRAQVMDMRLIGNDHTGALVKLMYGSQCNLTNLECYANNGAAIDLIRVFDTVLDGMFLDHCGSTDGTIPSLWIRNSGAASGTGYSVGQTNMIYVRGLRVESFRAAISVERGTGSNVDPYGIYFHGLKCETYYARGTAINVVNVRGISFRDVDLSLLGLDSGASAVVGINWAPLWRSKIDGLRINMGASVVYRGIDSWLPGSGSHEIANVEGEGGTPGDCLINHNTTNPADVRGITTQAGALQHGGPVPAPVGASTTDFIPGIVVDGGVTDNYTAINAYLTAVGAGAANNLVLPSGRIGVGTEIVPPLGVTLRGCGSNNIPGAYPTDPSGGTVLVPLRTGAAQTSLVHLSNAQSGIQDLSLYATDDTRTYSCSNALIVDAWQCTGYNVGIYGGSVAVLSGTANALQFVGSDIYVKSIIETSSTLCLSNLAPDWHVTNMIVAGRPSTLLGGQSTWVNCHFNLGPTGTLAHPVITDGGSNTFTACYFDSALPGAPAMIDRTAATSSSQYNGCRWVQNSTTAATGLPIFQEASDAANGVQVNGGTVQPIQGGASSFTYFIQGWSATTVCVGLVCKPALSVGFSDAAFGVGTSVGNVLGVTPLASNLPNGLTVTKGANSGNVRSQPGHPVYVGEETMDRLVAGMGIAPASGTAVFTFFTARKTETASHIVVALQNAAAGLTAAYLGLYTFDGSTLTRVAVSANSNTSFGGAWGAVTLSIGSVTKTAGQLYAVGMLFVGTTPPQIQGCYPVAARWDTYPPVCGALGSQATLPASTTISALIGGPALYAEIAP